MSNEAPVTIAVDFDPFAEEVDGYTLPLTEPLREMWAAAQMGEQASCSYNQTFVLTLRGRLSVESMESALRQVIEHHDSLRVSIDNEGEQQRIAATVPVTLPVVDLTGLSENAQREEVRKILQAEAVEPFDLAAAPLLRARLVRESVDVHRLILTVHHIVCDGWSSSVLLGDLARIYAADRHGLPAQLPPTFPYREYVAREAARDSNPQAREDEEYWVGQFADGIPVLDLPLDRRRPALKTYSGALQTLKIDESLYRAVKTTGARHGCTPFVTLLAAFQGLIMRLSGQDDFILGIPMAGQGQLENPRLVGHCVNLIPLRCRLQPSASFADHLGQVRSAFLEAQSHQQLTFGSLLQRLSIPRDPGRTPLVAVTFNIDRTGAPFDFGELTLTGVETAPKRYVNFEFSINVVDDGRELVVECEYNTDLYDRATIERWLMHFKVLLASVAANPNTPLTSLELLTDDERQQLISRWNRYEQYDCAACLHQRFERQAASTPDAIAITCDGHSLTYAELNRRANRIAHHLRALGVAPNELVGLRMERGIELVVAILGILKSGAGYLPLDPAYPQARVAYMLEDSRVSVVLTEKSLAPDLASSPVEIVLLDEPIAAPETDPPCVSRTDHLAYVIYTSGSTGRPKGVQITHYNVTRLFDATDAWFHFDRHDVWTLFHSYAFDFSVWELWGALLYGGRVVVVPYWVSRSPEAFRDLLVNERVSVLNQTPAAFGQLINADLSSPKADYALRYVIFGGEALELQALRPWFERYGDEQPLLVNMYGITETTVHVTYRPIRLADLDSGHGSVIGTPIPDLQLYLLDSCGKPVPVGIPGEIHVGGAGVARGYLNRGELTAQRFIDDPFSGRAGAKLYRTGDLARRLEDGDIEYIGRIDHQVKIRGFRVELGEIEAALLQQPTVQHVAVIAREDKPGDKRLVAYFVSNNEDPDFVDQLRASLRATMPDYMVPAHFIRLSRLPLTHNGKLDRKALPPPDLIPNATRPTPVAPRTPPEELVARLFGEVLNRKDIGVYDDFFDLGGDSLKAARLMARLRAASGVDLPLRNLFERPTVAQMAEALAALSWAAASAEPARGAGKREQLEL